LTSLLNDSRLTSAYLHLQGATVRQCSPSLRSIYGGAYLAIPLIVIGKVFTSFFNSKHNRHTKISKSLLSYQEYQSYCHITATTADIQTHCYVHFRLRTTWTL